MSALPPEQMEALVAVSDSIAQLAKAIEGATRYNPPHITCMRCAAGFHFTADFATHRAETPCGDPERLMGIAVPS